jgi:hypothetical protein
VRDFLICAAVIVVADLGIWLAKIYWQAFREVLAERRLEGR